MLKTIRQFFTSPSGRLACTYLLIIMLMSIGFSFVFYHTSSHELGRQIPPDGLFRGAYGGVQPEGVGQFFRDRVHEGRNELLMRLVLLNILALVMGSVVSYWLARRSLQPIEEAMDAQTQFVSDASHELRTPLTAIQTSNEVALRKPKLTVNEAKEIIRRNIDDVSRLKQLSDGLLNLARQNNKALKLQAVSVQAAVSEAMGQVVAPATDKHIAVDDQTSKLSVVANADNLAQLLVILLDNAIKYSPADTTITVSTQSHGKHASISVADQGIGIRASDLPHIFRRFYRADSARTITQQEGYGLGLAIAEQLAKHMHGEISVSSTPGTGSTFTIKLPIA